MTNDQQSLHVIIVGCGRVGSTLARELCEGGHDVVVVDRKADAFHRLGDTYSGGTLIGVGFDRDVLRSAGITPDSAVMAVTSGDNSNILIARVARETFGVSRVVARIYDPKRAKVYERLGIPTVASVAWTCARVLRAVMPDGDAIEWTDPTGSHVLVERRVPPGAAGRAIADLEAAGLRVALLTRNGTARLPTSIQLIQEGDGLQLVVPADSLQVVDLVLADRHSTERAAAH
jgi:trk system potassium uptake protein TrkA